MSALRIVTTAAAVLLTASVAATAAGPPSPPTVPGWPKGLPAGPVVQGPQGGLVLVSPYGDGFAARAFRRDGRRLWSQSEPANCGNCDGGPQPVVNEPDGTVGPIGHLGDYAWAVDPAGRLATPCLGVMFGDGSCVGGVNLLSFPEPGERPAFYGFPPGRRDLRWTLPVPGWSWSSDSPPMAVRDGAGIVYVAFAGPRPIGTPSAPAVDGILVALDPVARRILWVVEGPTEVLTGLASGVLVSQRGGIAAHRPDGTVAWTRAMPEGQGTYPSAVVFDAPRGRIYLGRVPSDSSRPEAGVTALVATTGAQVWRTRPADRARLVSVGRGGRVYVAVDRNGSLAVRGLRLANGATAWERRTGRPVQGARELVNGTVAVSAGPRFGGGPGVLTLLDPR